PHPRRTRGLLAHAAHRGAWPRRRGGRRRPHRRGGIPSRDHRVPGRGAGLPHHPGDVRLRDRLGGSAAPRRALPPGHLRPPRERAGAPRPGRRDPVLGRGRSGLRAGPHATAERGGVRLRLAGAPRSAQLGRHHAHGRRERRGHALAIRTV
ncbi:MAG: hypothetical protein AVDCRST_MAG91-2021, partial [uncultured Sphingomonadaceae bacterium]